MATESDRVQWSRAASIMAAIYNAAGGRDGKAIDPKEFSPYENQSSRSGTRVPLTQETFHLLKQLAR